MKLIRFLTPEGRLAQGALQPDGKAREIEGDILGQHRLRPGATVVRKRLAPVVPAMIWGIGLNYRKFAELTKATVPENPLVFAKGPNALQHPDEPIRIPTTLRTEQVDYEGELAVVIGRAARNVSVAHALDYVLGYTCANDVSSRDWQVRCAGQWCRSKTFDTFAPLGPCLVTADEIPQPNNLNLRTELNGEVVQDANTNDMIVNVPALISFLSASTTLVPGTVILTGTPAGAGMSRSPQRWLRPGDVVSVEIQGIGRLTNPVALEAA